MALLGFKEQFVPHILSGRKPHTIRAIRKVPIRIGEALHMYGKVRQKGMYRIAPATPCTKVEEIILKSSKLIELQGCDLNRDECELLAYADGFDDLAAMMKFWEGKYPFTGHLIRWTPFKEVQRG